MKDMKLEWKKCVQYCHWENIVAEHPLGTSEVVGRTVLKH